MAQLDFSDRKTFPGTKGGPFEILITSAEKLPVFALALLLLAALPAAGQPNLTLAFWLFMLGDWVLLAALPVARRSFGPPKAPTVLLALLRLPAALLPTPWSLLLQAVGTLLVIYGFWVEPHWISLGHQFIRQ